MPEVVVYLAEGRSLDQKRGLVKEITDAVVKNCKVEPGVVTLTWLGMPPGVENCVKRRRRPVSSCET